MTLVAPIGDLGGTQCGGTHMSTVTPTCDLTVTYMWPWWHPRVNLVAPKHDLGGTQRGGTHMIPMAPTCDLGDTHT